MNRSPIVQSFVAPSSVFVCDDDTKVFAIARTGSEAKLTSDEVT